uniref:Beta-lactamase-related domain-containing protein n=1 Tax=Corethron hystrix TaxID=216773 RepID=A0A7S1FN09_9STRA|mmetsp:Transcript_15053/g.33576  ORF Transcript_15053/g.33576 Transcript_15053/m.33576 type:complete len:1642 (+) Transcript_15053:320-5245(+)
MKALASAVLTAYVAVWVWFYLLVHHTHDKGVRSSTDAPSIILVVEMVKLVFSSLIFCKMRGISELIQFFHNGHLFFKTSIYYLPIALLYAVYNYLMLANIRANHPTVYLIFSSSRLLMVAYTWQTIFRIQFPPLKKVGLALITCGIFAKGYNSSAGGGDYASSADYSTTSMLSGGLLILVQMACSVVASVYNEKLLKGNPCNQHLQNICLYINSIVINCVIFTFMNTDSDKESPVFTLDSAKIIITLASAGIISSMVLRFVDSVTKSVASASEIVFTYIIDVLFFQYSLTFAEIVSVGFVMTGTVLYSMKNAPKNYRKDKKVLPNSFPKNMSKDKNLLIRSASIMMTAGTILFTINVSIMNQYPNSIHRSTFEDQHQQDSAMLAPILTNKALPLCTKEQTSSRNSTEGYQINQVRAKRNAHKQKAAEEVIYFIVEQLSKIGAPAALMYGTLLHEFRNGTGPCVVPRADDKDFDIAVFEEHFRLIADMTQEIESMFGFKVVTYEKQSLFLSLVPPGQKKPGIGFQIDVYGFQCDDTNRLLYFPWDDVAVRTEHFLPLLKHKTLPVDTRRTSDETEPLYHHIPFNPRCLLANMYGEDFMTPKIGHFIQHDVFSRLESFRCEQTMTVLEHQEFDRQQSFCQSRQIDVTKFSPPKARFLPNHSTVTLTQAGKGSTRNTAISMNDKPSLSQSDDLRSSMNNGSVAQEDKDSSTRNTTISKNIKRHLPQSDNLKSGIITCIENREDSAHALVLAESVNDFNNQEEGESIYLEIYHVSKLSQFISAKLESFQGVSVVDLQQQSTSCFIDAISTTVLGNIFLSKPSIVLLPREMKRRQGLPFAHIFEEECENRNFTHTVVLTLDELDKEVEVLTSTQDPCKYQYLRAHNQQSLASQRKMMSIHNYVPTKGSSRNIRLSYLYPNAPYEWFLSNNEESVRVPCTNPSICDEVSRIIDRNAHRHAKALRSLLLDRPLNWVAFDGGLVSQPQRKNQISIPCSRFNSLEGAKRSVKAAISNTDQEVMVNIDLVSTADNVSIAMHNEESFGGYTFEGNQLPHQNSISRINFDDARKRHLNPCLPENIVQTWFDPNRYREYSKCGEECAEPISRMEDIIDNITILSEVVFDLKSSSSSYDQANDILKIIRNTTNNGNIASRISVRYFSASKTHDKLLSEVLPDHVFDQIESGTFPSDLKIYMNAPSKEACLLLATWSNRRFVRLAGCFVQNNNADIERSWKHIFKNITSSGVMNIAVPLANNLRIICDVPRKQEVGNPAMWKDGLVSCVENGFDWIHFPFAPSKADTTVPFSSTIGSILSHGSEVETILSKSKDALAQSSKTDFGTIDSNQTTWDNYVSHWGVTSPFFWKPEDQKWSFTGQSMSSPPEAKTGIYRCVTKILTIMLFLRLEEIGLLSVDDKVTGLANDITVTWRQVFTNTAGVDGSEAGMHFVYSNSLWSHVAASIANATGMTFLDVMDYYIIQPMGLKGHFDVDTVYPPYTASGFLGTNEDLMIIGSTLASGGISPKTRLQVISNKSVDEMLKDWTSVQNVRDSFSKDHTVDSMKRFHDGRSAEFKFNIVDGYGMGLWRVNGWRTMGKDETPVRGWLAMGSSEALLYFDVDMIVVTMLAQQHIEGLEMTAPFANLIKNMTEIPQYS